MEANRCPMCGGIVPAGVARCRDLFNEVCAREYSDPAFGAVHLLTVDAYALQHSEEHGPRSNAFHLARLGRLMERGESAAIGQRPPRAVGKAEESRYRQFPELEPPAFRGSLTIADVPSASDPDDHARRVWAWARSVWEAYRQHHGWAHGIDASGS